MAQLLVKGHDEEAVHDTDVYKAYCGQIHEKVVHDVDKLSNQLYEGVQLQFAPPAATDSAPGENLFILHVHAWDVQLGPCPSDSTVSQVLLAIAQDPNYEDHQLDIASQSESVLL